MKKILSYILISALSAQLSFSASAAKETLSVSAKSAVLIEADGGDVIFEKNADEKLPMASTTKIMTAVVALENCDAEKTVTVSPDAVGVEGSSVYLEAGEKILMRDLLYAMMLESANDAASAIAIDAAGSIEAFAELMNEKAESLGLSDTHFTNPHGLDDEEHYTSARDLARLTAYALKNPDFRRIVSTWKTTIPLPDGDGTRLLLNHNRLLKSYGPTIGVKTGFTKRSGRCLVSAAERDGVTLIAVTLSDPDDWADHKAMLEYGFERYERRVLAEKAVSIELPVIGGAASGVRCTSTESPVLTLPKGTRVVMRVEADRFVPAPVKKGDALAKAIFSAEGRDVAQIPLFAVCDVPESTKRLGLFERILQFFGR